MRAKAVVLTALTLLACGLALPWVFGQQQPPEAPPPQDDEVTLELRRNQRPLIRLAIPAFTGTRGLAGEAGAAARELEETVRTDLEASGYFEIQGPWAFSALELSGDLPRDLEQYRSLGNEVLVLGDVRSEAGRLVFEGRLFDLASAQSILAKRYRGSFSVANRMGHTFANEVINRLTGRPGISLTSIAFTSDRSGHKEIYQMDYDGKSQRPVTGHRSTSMSPAWSPTGDGLAYTSFFKGPPGIFFADLTSGRKRTVITSGSLNITPTFSPDGNRIAFGRSVDGNVEIFTADRSGNGQRRLTTSNAIDTNPAWSPKGSEIAFTSSRAGNPHIYLMDAEGANQRRLTFEGDYNDGAAWSPEGDRIAYTTRRGGRFQIAVTNVVTLETRVLTSGRGENESPTFSPDGRKIAYTSRRSGTKQIYVIDVADGGNARQLTSQGNNDMADWSRLQ